MKLSTRARYALRMMVEITRQTTDETPALTLKEIADHLGISLHTVDMHLRSVYRKLHVCTQTEAVSKAIRKGIV